MTSGVQTDTPPMTKRESIHQWLLTQSDWVYLNEVPKTFGTPACISSALRDLCASDRADFRIVGLTQYRAKKAPTPKKGPKPPKGKI